MVKLTLIQGDCLKVLPKLPNESVDLVVTSPPYNAGFEYEEDLNEREYFEFIENVLIEIYRVLKKSGRVCWNVSFIIYNSNTKKKFFIAPKTVLLFEKIGFLPMDLIIWHKGKSSTHFCGNNTSWGSFKSPSYPYMRPLSESILIFAKEKLKLESKGETDITANEFKEWTKNIWYIPTSQKDKEFHPTTFPLELPYRCIKLFTWKNTTVLDPFLGSGTTMKACLELKRNCIGIEINPEYIQVIKKRLNWGYLFGNVEFEFLREEDFEECDG
jgi:site-specific DNA-methyltransferase (adenine-specific)